MLNARGEVERPAAPSAPEPAPELLPEVTAPPPPSPRTRWPFIILAGVIVAAGALIGGGALVARELREMTQQRLSEVIAARRQQLPAVLEQLPRLGETLPVVVTSEPDGATIRVGGEVIGVTPWAGDNVWSGEQPVVLELRGYRPWQGSLQGGREVRLSARLTR